jgi:hypothetical protein
MSKTADLLQLLHPLRPGSSRVAYVPRNLDAFWTLVGNALSPQRPLGPLLVDAFEVTVNSWAAIFQSEDAGRQVVSDARRQFLAKSGKSGKRPVVLGRNAN